MEVERDLRWRVETTGVLGQRLLLVLVIIPVLRIIMAEGCRAGVRRGILESDARAIREWVSCVVRRFAGWQGWSIGHRPLGGGGGGQEEGGVEIRRAIPIMKEK